MTLKWVSEEEKKVGVEDLIQKEEVARPRCARGKGLCIWRVESWLLWLKHTWEMILERGAGASW